MRLELDQEELGMARKGWLEFYIPGEATAIAAGALAGHLGKGLAFRRKALLAAG